MNFVRRFFDACYQYLQSESGGGGSTKGATAYEQVAIAAFLDATLSKLAKTHTLVETAIARLTEYRAALIAAAVTGQLAIATTE